MYSGVGTCSHRRCTIVSIAMITWTLDTTRIPNTQTVVLYTSHNVHPLSHTRVTAHCVRSAQNNKFQFGRGGGLLAPGGGGSLNGAALLYTPHPYKSTLGFPGGGMGGLESFIYCNLLCEHRLRIKSVITIALS